MFEKFGKIKNEILKKLVENSNPDNKIIVDLGSGNPAITDNIKCKKRIKIDIDPQTLPDIVHDFSNGIPLEDNSVDICFASEVIEHLYYSKKFISEIKRILKNDGYIILSCPNICSLKYRLAFLLGYIPAHAAKADCFYKDERYGHIRDYNFSELENILNSFGFKTFWSGTDGISLKGITLISRNVIPKTFGDQIIISTFAGT